jgi:hypothetical protein
MTPGMFHLLAAEKALFRHAMDNNQAVVEGVSSNISPHWSVVRPVSGRTSEILVSARYFHLSDFDTIHSLNCVGKPVFSSNHFAKNDCLTYQLQKAGMSVFIPISGSMIFSFLSFVYKERSGSFRL